MTRGSFTTRSSARFTQSLRMRTFTSHAFEKDGRCYVRVFEFPLIRSLNRLDAARPMEIRDLESLGPLVESSLRSDATAQGPWLSKSRISTDSASNLYLYRKLTK